MNKKHEQKRADQAIFTSTFSFFLYIASDATLNHPLEIEITTISLCIT
ncbi:MAG: hypothetical protein H0X62_12700 [Bacteroidetes bacterium]|nr:hypothetical protein [Bacteroidota bacterium]